MKMITRTATIASAVGLHARPAALFVQKASATGYEVTIKLGDKEADASSVLEVMTLGAKNSDVVELSCEDDSAAEALDSLVELLETDLDA